MIDIAADTLRTTHRPPVAAGVRGWLRTRRTFLLVVVLPTLLTAAYYGVIASNQYESEADFVVRASQDQAPPPSGLSQVLNLAGGATESQAQSMAVSDYLNSHDAVAALRSENGLVERFRRPEVDPISRLFSANPRAETLLKYYRRHIDVDYSSETGITTLRVRSFRPEDSYALISALLKLGEKRVNALNERMFEDTLAVANRQLGDAEVAVAQTQTTMTGFRQENRDIDPSGTGAAQIKLVSDLTGTLAAARAQLASMAGVIRPDSPQYMAQAARVRALEAQVAGQSSRLTSGDGRSLATDLGAYEGLRLKQDFAAKRYASAAAALEQARDRAMKQQLFVVRVVEPNVPEKSTYPKRLTIIATVFFGLLFAYAIGWLIVAGVREHAA